MPTNLKIALVNDAAVIAAALIGWHATVLAALIAAIALIAATAA